MTSHNLSLCACHHAILVNLQQHQNYYENSQVNLGDTSEGPCCTHWRAPAYPLKSSRDEQSGIRQAEGHTFMDTDDLHLLNDSLVSSSKAILPHDEDTNKRSFDVIWECRHTPSRISSVQSSVLTAKLLYRADRALPLLHHLKKCLILKDGYQTSHGNMCER